MSLKMEKRGGPNSDSNRTIKGLTPFFWGGKRIKNKGGVLGNFFYKAGAPKESFIIFRDGGQVDLGANLKMVGFFSNFLILWGGL